MEWIHISGGPVPAGEWHPAQEVATLGWALTPLSVAGMPLTGLTLPRAAQLAHRLGVRIPPSAEWEWMASGAVRRFPWGNQIPGPRHANLR